MYKIDVNRSSHYLFLAVFVLFFALITSLYYIPLDDTEFKIGIEWKDWSRLHKSNPRYTHQPNSKSEVVSIVKQAIKKSEKIRVVGASTSTSDIALSSDHVLNMDLMNSILKVDKDKLLVTAEAGIRLHRLNDVLADHGLTITTAGSNNRVSLGGAISVGLFSSGNQLKSISNSVVAVEIVNGKGEILEISSLNLPELLPAVRLSLGALGVITSVTLSVERVSVLRYREVSASTDIFQQHFDKFVVDNRFISFQWLPPCPETRMLLANPVSQSDDLRMDFERTLESQRRVLESGFLWILSHFPEHWAWYNKYFIGPITYRSFPDFLDRSDRALAFTPFLQFQEIEYFVPYEKGLEAFIATQTKFLNGNDSSFITNLPVHIRVAEADDTWLSPQYKQKTVGISLSILNNYRQFDRVSNEFGKLMEKFGGRPSWRATHHKNYAQLTDLFPKLEEFKKLQADFDPHQVFVNAYMSRILDI